VLHGVDLAIHPGEIVAIVGPNGGGKSTLLRSLLGSLPLQSGMRRAAPGLRLGYVPQELQVDRDQPLAVHDVVAMGGWGRAGAALSVAEALDRVGLLALAAARFGALSSGQRQRVLLARALVCDPQLLLLDEPVSGVDSAAQATIYRTLSGHARASGAIVIVTHQPDALAAWTTRWVRVENGRTSILTEAAR
jgi:ABC-type Mn2+/Zn2+ transport system ATPase subunit